MKKFKRHSVLAIVVLAFAITADAQTLTAVQATGSASTTNATFSSVRNVSVTINATDVNAVLVVSTFQMDMHFASAADRDAGYRLVDSADNTINSGEFHRSLSNAKQFDYGIGSIVHIFDISALTGDRSYLLQHKISNNKDLTTVATIAAIALKSGSEHLKNDVKRVSAPVSMSGSWTEVTGSETTTITTTVSGGFYVAASVESKATIAPALGEWKLQYQIGAGSWTDLTSEIQRSMSNTNDIGNISLVGTLSDSTVAGDYKFRIVHRQTSGAANTTVANIVAVSLGTAGGIFPVFSHTATKSTTSTILEDAATVTMTPSVNTKLFIHAQYEMSATAESNAPRFDLFVDNAMLDGLDQKRYLSDSSDYGSGASVGLSDELTASTTYNVSLRHASTSNVTLTTSDISLNGFELTVGSVPLPIELLYFNAQCSDDSRVIVTWATASEINNDYFTIYRSADGVSFENIGVVAGAGNSNQTLDYSFIDCDALSGISYYRLKQTDFDGHFENSKIVPVSCIDEVLRDIKVYPNPVTNELTIEIAGNNERISFVIINSMGAVVYKGEINQKITVHTLHFAPGTYIIKFENDKTHKFKKVIKE